MKKLSFQDFKELCKLNMNKRHIVECMDTIKNADCLFHSGIVMPKDQISSLYNLRLQIAKEKNSLSEDYIRDFEDCVSQLKLSTSKELAITTLYGESEAFIIFYEPETKIILGVLKPINSMGLKKMEENNTETITKGYSSSFEKYSRGVFIKNWNKLSNQ